MQHSVIPNTGAKKFLVLRCWHDWGTTLEIPVSKLYRLIFRLRKFLCEEAKKLIVLLEEIEQVVNVHQ